MLNLGSVESEELRLRADRAALVDGVPDLGRRALRGYLKAHKAVIETPITLFIEFSAKQYVALIEKANIAAIYRIRNDLQLKRMRRIPEPVAFAAELFRRQNS